MKSSIKLYVIIFICVFSLGMIFANDVWSAANPVLFMSFDEGKGNTVKDLSGNGNDGELINGPAWVDGKRGKALEFNGANFVLVELSETLAELTKDFSATFWVLKKDPQKGPWNYMVAADRVRWGIIYNGDDKSAYVYASNPGWQLNAKTSDPLPEEWTHLAVVFDTGDKVKIYFNGEVAVEGIKPQETIEIVQCYMIGAIATAGGCPAGEQMFTGIIDDLAIYNGILSEEEIDRDMSGNVAGLAPVDPVGKLGSSWGTIKTLY